MALGTATKRYEKSTDVVTCDKKNLPWFGVKYDFYPTRCVFSILSSRLRNKKNSLDENDIQPQAMGDPISRENQNSLLQR